MKKIFDNILASFNGSPMGYSARKLSAFAIIVMVIITHIKWLTLGDLSQMEMVLTIDYSFIAALFGLTTYSSIKYNGSEKQVGTTVNKEPVIDEPYDEPEVGEPGTDTPIVKIPK